MSLLLKISSAVELGGTLMIPLSFLCILAIALIFDKLLFYKKFVQLPKSFLVLLEACSLDYNILSAELKKMSVKNCYYKFFSKILENKKQPIWWIESRSASEAKLIEKELTSSLWILETIVTVAPLLGLLGTIVGMMSSFRIIGTNGAVNPTGVTAGVAESLIATGFGLVIAIFALFAFNYFSKKSDQVLDEFENFGTRIIDHIKLDNEN